MTAKDVQKRNGKSEGLRVLKVGEGEFYTSSSDGKICYLVNLNGKEACTCADYITNVKKDQNFRCKHILAVIACDRNYETGEFLERKKPKLDERFISNIQGRDFVLYAGLLDLAHQKGLMKLEVETIQIPTQGNNFEAICKAIAESKTGDVFIDVGDANPRNCNKSIAQHIIRMASTRAKARALRDYTNVGMTALEELGDLDDVIANGHANGKHKKPAPQNGSNGQNGQYGKSKPPVLQPAAVDQPKDKEATEKPAEEKAPDQAKSESGNGNGNGNGSKAKASDNGSKDNGKVKDNGTSTMSEAQKRAMLNLSKRRGISEDELQKLAHEQYGVPVEELSSQDAGTFIRQLQSVS